MNNEFKKAFAKIFTKVTQLYCIATYWYY